MIRLTFFDRASHNLIGSLKAGIAPHHVIEESVQVFLPLMSSVSGYRKAPSGKQALLLAEAHVLEASRESLVTSYHAVVSS